MVKRTIAAAELRAYEIAVAISEHIQWLGFDGKAHVNPYGDVDIERLSVMAGLTVRKDNKIINPFLKQSFALAVVTTNYELNIDLPLSESSLTGKRIGYFGSRWSGAGIEWARREKKNSLELYPLRQLKELIGPLLLFLMMKFLVPKRAEFFARAQDLEKSQELSGLGSLLSTPCYVNGKSDKTHGS